VRSVVKTGVGGKPNDHGVSEVIGFIVILALMITGIGLVTLYGYPILLQEQASANVRNMEKNFIVIQTDINSLSFRNVPYKETSLQVSGGTLSILKEPDTTPSGASFTISNSSPVITFYPGNLVFQSTDGQADVVLENGAVHINYWSDRTGSAMISDPRWYYDQNTRTLVIPLIRLNATNDMSQIGMGTIRMQLADTPYDTVIIPDGISEPFSITYDPDSQNDYRVAWRNYITTSDLGLEEKNTGSSIKFTNSTSSPVDKIIVKQYNLTVLSI
jgi:hypothetical protein